eukprot:5478730-Pleurochrysis_carterae.AAC.2
MPSAVLSADILIRCHIKRRASRHGSNVLVPVLVESPSLLSRRYHNIVPGFCPLACSDGRRAADAVVCCQNNAVAGGGPCRGLAVAHNALWKPLAA